eukprot:m.32428 g.32428  ORF g.32428 m.32428 type:complete len:114 (-) comp14966_c0_seq2:8-349(-)
MSISLVCLAPLPTYFCSRSAFLQTRMKAVMVEALERYFELAEQRPSLQAVVSVVYGRFHRAPAAIYHATTDIHQEVRSLQHANENFEDRVLRLLQHQQNQIDRLDRKINALST